MSNSAKKPYDAKLDKFEQTIEDNLEHAQRLLPENEAEEKLLAKAVAQHQKRRAKEKRISIRIFAKDLENIKLLAEEEGLPYQTLITSVLHKFSTGRFKDVHKERA